MPSQKPLIDLDKLDRNRGEQLKSIDGLAARLQPGIARDGYSVSVQALVSLMTKLDSLTSPQRPYTWHGIAHWSGMTGLSPKQCSRAICVLQSLQLIEARVTWVSHGKRGMKVKINWSTVFEAGPITQDAEDLALWTARKNRQRTLFTPRRTPQPTPVVSVSETDTMSVSTICNPQTYSLNQSAAGEGVGGDFEFTTEARRHGDENSQQGPHPLLPRHVDARLVQTIQSRIQDGTPYLVAEAPSSKPQQSIHCSSASTGTQRIISTADHRSARVADVADVPPGQLFQFSNPSADQTVRTTIPAEFDSIVKRLISLGVADGRSAVRKSLTAGYSPTGITAILDWYQAEALPDEHGKLVYPYDPGQLVLRLRDRDAIAAEPAQGNWQGGKSGFWTRLAPISTPKPRKPAPERPATPKPDRIPVPTTYTTPLSLSEIAEAMDAHQAPGMVRQSAGRMREGERGKGGEVPKTLARWMKTVGLQVDERVETSDQSQQGGGN